MNEENTAQQGQEHIAKMSDPAPPGSGSGGVAVKTAPAEGGNIDVNDAQVFAEQTAEAERRFAQQQEQDRKLLAALDEVLEKRSRQMESESPKRPGGKAKRAAAAVAGKGAGFVSLGIILVFMGIVMMTTLCSQNPNYTVPLKLSPICAILIGAEILITYVVTRGRPRVNIPCLVISALLVTGCCLLCAKLGGDYREETVEYNNRTVAGEIYDKSYKQLKSVADIIDVDVNVNLNPNGSVRLNGLEALTSSDIVDIGVEFGGVYESPKLFAADCRKVIEAYRVMGITITNFHFKNESRLRSYTLDVEGKYAQDLSGTRLEALVNYVYVDDYDYIEDLPDYTETSGTTSNAAN